MTQPFIIIGMHRSGTTLVTHLLQQMGVHMGWQLESNAESVFFLSLNRWVFRVAGAAWDQPKPMQQFLNKANVRDKTADYLQTVLHSPRVIQHMGLGAYLHHRQLDKQTRIWGWKDPRTTWTLPIWLDIFPQAKVIHVYRHGVDVALSLQKRSQDDLDKQRNRINRAYHVATKERIFKLVHSVGCLDLQFGFDLWAEYVKMAQQEMATAQNHLTLCYETLLQNPERGLEQLADFVGSSIIPSVDMHSERAFAFRNKPAGMAFYEQVANHPLLQELGYSMSVSLIILNYNTPDLLMSLLGYIADDAHRLGWQVVLVDNGSEENPLAAVAEKFAYVHLIRNEQNLGFAAGNNMGLRAATGEFVFLLNSDIVVSVAQLQQLVNYLAENPAVGAVSPLLLTSDNEPQAFAFGDSPRPSYLIRRALTAVFKKDSLHDWNTTTPIEAEWITAACLAVRRAVIDQVGLLDENFFLYFEDIDWCVRMGQAGWRLVYNPEVKIVHLGGYSQPQRDIANQFYYESMNYYYRKHFPKWRWLPRLLLPFYRLARKKG